MNNEVLIHFDLNATNHLKDLGIKYEQSHGELHSIVEDVPYKNGNHPDMNGIWQDPDIQLCEHYGINYDLVNCIEAV